MFGTAGGWPTVAVGVVAAVGVWLWARRRLAGVSGVERGLRWGDGRHVNARCDPVAHYAGYMTCGAAASVALYAGGAQTGRIEAATALMPILVLALVGGVAVWAVGLRMHSLARRADVASPQAQTQAAPALHHLR